MTDQQQAAELSEHGHRIAQLELKVAELYKRIGEVEPSFGSGDGVDASGSAQSLGFSDPSSAAAEHPRIVELLAEGKEIQAIKLYRELTGCGLAEAKAAIDQLKPTG